MTLPILQPQKLPPANDGHVRSALTADERLLRKAVARCFKAQVAEVHGKVEDGAKSNAVPEKTTKWDQEVMREVRPIWFGLFKKGGDKALKSVRKFPKHAKKMAVLGEAEMRASERVEVVEKGGPGSGNFGHEGRPGEVGGSGPGGGPARQEDKPLARFSYGKYNVMGKKFFSKHEKELRQWGKTVSAESIEALSDYQNTGADWVNSNLRKGKDPDSIGVKNLDAAMTFKLPEDVIVYRGVSSSVAEKLGKEGSVKKDLGYMSTTYDSRVLTPSSRRWPYEEILTICVPKGTYVCIPKFSNVGGWRREREVILPRGSKFVVRDSSQASLGNYMLELLPPQKSIDDMGFGFSFNDEQEWSMVLEELIQFSEKSLKASPSIVIPEWIEDPDVLDALEAEMFEFAHNINQTTADALREELLDGMENGETISQLKNRISDISDEWVEGYRSERIARTETARAFSIGHIEAWKSTDVVGRKVWSTAGDCCPFCAELEGVAVGLDENFFKLGDEQTVEWRGKDLVMAHDYSDIKGPPLHPNCRCALIGELIDDRKAAKDGGEEIVKEEKGGPGSGNFGHEGRPGEVGGSAEDAAKERKEKLSQLKEQMVEAERRAQSAFRKYEKVKREAAKATTSLLGSNPFDAQLRAAAAESDSANAEFIKARDAYGAVAYRQ